MSAIGEFLTPSQFYDAVIGVSWCALPLFAIMTVIAMVGEMFTKFANAGLGYYFIMLALPAFCVAWLCLLIFATYRALPTSWLVTALSTAAVFAGVYGNIG